MADKLEKYEDTETSTWWKKVSIMPSRRLPHRMVSDAIWYAMMQAAHAHYFKFVHMRSRTLDKAVKYRQALRARAYLDAFDQIVHEMLSMGMLEAKPDAYNKLCEYSEAASQACREIEIEEDA